MAISKIPVRVGGAEALEPNSGLPMFRLFLRFDGNREEETITVYYSEWLESGTVKLGTKVKQYSVMDLPEIPYLAFTGWHDKIVTEEMVGLKLGEHLIIGQINSTLTNLPFDVEDEHITQP